MKKVAALVVVFAAAVVVWMNKDRFGATTDGGNEVFCGFETTTEKDGMTFFTANDVLFFNGHTQTHDLARTGNACVMLDGTGDRVYGPSYTFTDVNYGDEFEATVWRKSESGEGALALTGNWDFYRDTKKVVEEKDGWQLLRMSFTVLEEIRGKELMFHLWTSKEGAVVYFDDFKIVKKRSYELKEVNTIDSSNLLSITIPDSSFEQIKAKRNDAIQKKILFSSKADWVMASAALADTTIPVKVRLKGDWTDHLTGNKWSYRVKTSKTQYWNHLREFSIQSPATRSFLDEWVFHEFLRREDVMTTRYRFIHLFVNDNNHGIYALEEHFEKELMEHQQRREGPLLKFNEDELWNIRLVNELSDKWYLPVYESSEIRAFSAGKIRKNPVLKGQFDVAQNLMYQYKHGLKNPEDVFDLERLAKFFAIVDLTKAYHTLIWHNQRWYYNPVTAKLEPIGFDGYTNTGYFDYATHAILGHRLSENKRMLKKTGFLVHIFEDRAFYERYLHYLSEYSSEEYITAFMKSIDAPLKANEALLQQEYASYTYDPNFIVNSAAAVRSLLDSIDVAAILSEKYEEHPPHPYKAPEVVAGELPTHNVSVMAYQVEGASAFDVDVRNFHFLPITVVGGGNGALTKPTSSDTLRPYYKRLPPEQTTVTFDTAVTHIFYREQGSKEVYTTPIVMHNAPTNYAPSQALQAPSPMFEQLFEEKGGYWVLKQDRATISEDIIVPAGGVVDLSCTEMDFINGARFISYSPVVAKGTANHLVVIRSSDNSAGGFTVLQTNGAEQVSTLEYVRFDGFNTLNYNGWQLTGAVTFYESDVEMLGCEFTNNHCEDGLNIIRSHFIMQQCNISNTPSDGFDADFCTGAVSKSSFSDTKNDCIDFSGSVITISQCTINNAGDKGISGGENSTLTIDDVSINKAEIAIASKDLSSLQIKLLKVQNCKYGFAAFQKKPEFGGAEILVEGLTYDQIDTLHLIEQNSSMRLEGKFIEGTGKVDLAKMYGL